MPMADFAVVFCVVPGLMIPVLQHNNLLCLLKFFRGHNGGMAVLNSYLLFQGSAQHPMFTGNRHNEFRAHIGSLILLIFQNMVNRSTCPMAALQIPCFVLTVHMVFCHMIRCRGSGSAFHSGFLRWCLCCCPAMPVQKPGAHTGWLRGRGLAYGSHSYPAGIQTGGILRDPAASNR